MAEPMRFKEIREVGEWQVATALGASGTRWVSWAKRGRLIGSNPIDEPGDVWFNLGATREEAAAKTIAEIGAL